MTGLDALGECERLVPRNSLTAMPRPGGRLPNSNSAGDGEQFVGDDSAAAFGAMDVFLRLNGTRSTGDPREVAERFTECSANFANRVTTMEVAVAELARWLEPRCTQIVGVPGPRT